jgi:hypothetical protein
MVPSASKIGHRGNRKSARWGMTDHPGSKYNHGQDVRKDSCQAMGPQLRRYGQRLYPGRSPGTLGEGTALIGMQVMLPQEVGDARVDPIARATDPGTQPSRRVSSETLR